MSTYLPWSLFVVYSVMVGAMSIQRHFVGRQEFLGHPMDLPLQLYATLATLVTIGTICHCFVMIPWYWVTVLVVLSSIASSVCSAIVQLLFGSVLCLIASFIVWPVFAIWANIIISDLGR
jgi:hypothetical protein